jgi:hypothetical protein
MVVSAEHGEVVPILDDGTGPMEYGRDVVYVTAASEREAKHVGLRAFRLWWNRRGHYDRDYDCPWNGMEGRRLGRRPPDSGP